MIDPAPHAWVVGAHGMLGSALCRRLERSGTAVHRASVPWHDPDASVEALAGQAAELAAASGDVDLYWCAGAGVIATSTATLASELDVFDRALERIVAAGAVRTMFLASSAGGAYAGSTGLPFTEATDVCPNSPYGETKLAMERVAEAWSRRYGVSLLVGRISTLYGPGQDLSKPQGVIAQLCRAQVQRTPLPIWVPLDTIRDFVHVDDVAAMAIAGTQRLRSLPTGTTVIKILASQMPVTLGTVLGELRRLTRRRPLASLGSRSNTLYSGDLHYVSTTWPELDVYASTGFVAGLASTYADVARRIRQGAVA